MLKFQIPGDPVAKGRARATVRNGRVEHYTPAKTSAYETVVGLFARKAMRGREVYTGALALKVVFRLEVPASYSNKRRAACLDQIEFPAKKPDLDNLVKAVKDGCNGILWRDDSQVVALMAVKVYAVNAGVDVTLEPAVVTDLGDA